jgi:hypothetical protein
MATEGNCGKQNAIRKRDDEKKGKRNGVKMESEKVGEALEIEEILESTRQFYQSRNNGLTEEGV